MSIGDKWAEYGMGSMDKESSFKLLNAFYDAGRNFIDTFSNYEDESSEEFIGEWMETRGIRDQMVIATKVSAQVFELDSSTLNDRTICLVLDKRETRSQGRQAADTLRWQQHEDPPDLPRGVAQEAAHVLYRHPLPALGVLSCIAHIVTLDTDHCSSGLAQWDYSTSIEEVMNGLHALVMAGKVLYLVRVSRLRHHSHLLIRVSDPRESRTLPPG